MYEVKLCGVGLEDLKFKLRSVVYENTNLPTVEVHSLLK